MDGSAFAWLLRMDTTKDPSGRANRNDSPVAPHSLSRA